MELSGALNAAIPPPGSDSTAASSSDLCSSARRAAPSCRAGSSAPRTSSGGVRPPTARRRRTAGGARSPPSPRGMRGTGGGRTGATARSIDSTWAAAAAWSLRRARADMARPFPQCAGAQNPRMRTRESGDPPPKHAHNAPGQTFGRRFRFSFRTAKTRTAGRAPLAHRDPRLDRRPSWPPETTRANHHGTCRGSSLRFRNFSPSGNATTPALVAIATNESNRKKNLLRVRCARCANRRISSRAKAPRARPRARGRCCEVHAHE